MVEFMNLPNKLTLSRIILVPFCMFFICYPVFGDIWTPIVALVFFSVSSMTDMIDGKIARKYNLITNLGKFLDPVADKLLIIGCYTAIIVARRNEPVLCHVAFWCTFLIFFRELAVTSLRAMVMGKVDVAANIWGKIKTVSQMVCVIVVIIEPLFCRITGINTYSIASIVTMIFSSITAVFSGINYLRAYLPYLSKE